LTLLMGLATICLDWQEMTYQQEEEQTSLGKRLSQEAVTLALQGRWEEAAAVNQSILERFASDVAACNRLGRALTELGEFAKAREAYDKALELSPHNAIASKNLARLASLVETGASANGKAKMISSELFITEMGKAGVVKLENLAPTGVLVRIGVGAKVHLERKGQRLVVTSEDGEYLGEIEARYALRLARLMRGGNRYAAAILSAGDGGAQIIVREEYRHPSLAGLVSFPTVAKEHPHTYARAFPLTHGISPNERETSDRAEYFEEEGGEPDDEERAVLEGFSLLEEPANEGGFDQ